MQTSTLTADGHATEGVGFLTDRQFNRFVWAHANADQISGWLYRAGHYKVAGEDDVRVDAASTPSAPLPATYLAADEIQSLMRQLVRFTTHQDTANSVKGAELAIALGRAVSAADRNWPQEEKPHFVKHMRCGGCEQLTLAYRPPRWAGDKIRVDCWLGPSGTL